MKQPAKWKKNKKNSISTSLWRKRPAHAVQKPPLQYLRCNAGFMETFGTLSWKSRRSSEFSVEEGGRVGVWSSFPTEFSCYLTWNNYSCFRIEFRKIDSHICTRVFAPGWTVEFKNLFLLFVSFPFFSKWMYKVLAWYINNSAKYYRNSNIFLLPRK